MRDATGQPPDALELLRLTELVLESALRGRVSDEVLGPLLEMYLREGDMFLAWKDQNPTGAGNFGQWILDRLGEGGGL